MSARDVLNAPDEPVPPDVAGDVIICWCPQASRWFEVGDDGHAADDPCVSLPTRQQKQHLVVTERALPRFYAAWVERGQRAFGFGADRALHRLFAQAQRELLLDEFHATTLDLNASEAQFCRLIALIRDSLAHGGWNPWIETQSRLNPRSARRYAAVGRMLHAVTDKSDNIGRFALFQLEQISRLNTVPRAREALLEDPLLNFEGRQQRPSQMSADTIEDLVTAIKEGRLVVEQILVADGTGSGPISVIPGGGSGPTGGGDPLANDEVDYASLLEERIAIEQHTIPLARKALRRILRHTRKYLDLDSIPPSLPDDLFVLRQFSSALLTTGMRLTTLHEAIEALEVSHG